MTIIYSPRGVPQDWEEAVGLSSAVIAEKVLRGGWFVHHEPRSVALVEELRHRPFSMRFSYFFSMRALRRYQKASRIDHQHCDVRDRIYRAPIRFDVGFNRTTAPYPVTIENVNFGPMRAHAPGKKLLEHVIATALDLHSEGVSVFPNEDGNWKLIERGARLQKWPHGSYNFNNNVCAILLGVTRFTIDARSTLTREDVLRDLRSICDREDVDALNRLAERTDISAIVNGKHLPVCAFLFRGVTLRGLVYKFNDPGTRDGLWTQVGLDVQTELLLRRRLPSDDRLQQAVTKLLEPAL